MRKSVYCKKRRKKQQNHSKIWKSLKWKDYFSFSFWWLFNARVVKRSFHQRSQACFVGLVEEDVTMVNFLFNYYPCFKPMSSNIWIILQDFATRPGLGMEVAIVLTGELGQGRNVLASQIMSMILLKGGGNKKCVGKKYNHYGQSEHPYKVYVVINWTKNRILKKQ